MNLKEYALLYNTILNEAINESIPVSEKHFIRLVKSIYINPKIKYAFNAKEALKALENHFNSLHEKDIQTLNEPDRFNQLKDVQRKISFKLFNNKAALDFIANNKGVEKITEAQSNISELIYKNPNTTLKDHLKEDIDYLENQKKKITPKKAPVDYYYWIYPVEKLELLYKILLEEKMINETNWFLQSFLSFDSKPNTKTVWKLSQTSLFALLHLLFNQKKIFNSETIGVVSGKLFKIEKLKASSNSTNTSYERFFIRTKSKEYLEKKHSKIISIINRLDLHKTIVR